MADNFTPTDAIQSTGPETQTQSQMATPTTTMYVHATSLNIRDKASSSAKSMGKLLRGAQVEVVGSITPAGWALLANAVGEPPSLKKWVLAKAGKTDYLSKSKPAPLKKTVKPPPPPQPQTEDQPPPDPALTERPEFVLPVLGVLLVAYLWVTRK